MKNAVIYTRVSTDEQAEKGFSLRYQQEKLRKYCETQSIDIVAHFQDDYSAKTFDRPEFKKLKEYVSSNKKLVDSILFIKWDRFSRNTTDAYNMIKHFSKMNVEVQAIEQPINFDIPEQKFVLAFYLTMPEVENDRRGLNTRQGMIKAMKEGRWVSNAPIGYKNIRDAANKPIMVPNEKAYLINEMFEKMASGNFTQEEIRREYYKKGLKISKSHINRIFNSPAYIGKIRIPAFNDESEMLIDGLHTSIVSEELFYKVQEILNNSKKKGKALKPRDPNLPLRHHLKCPSCGRNLTGSASKGNGGKYYYYHCQRGCGTRYKADLAHSNFQSFMQEIKIKPEIAKLYKEIVKDVFEDSSKEQRKKLSVIEKDIITNNEKFSKIDNLLIENKIDDTTHKRMTREANEKIKDLLKQKSQYLTIDSEYNKYLKVGLNLLENLDIYYSHADLDLKDKLISSIFPDRLIYQDGNYRTNGTDNIISLLSDSFTENGELKKGITTSKNEQFPSGSAYGDRTRTLRLERAAC